MNKPSPKLKGRRFIILIRVSDASQGDQSAEAQFNLLKTYGDEAGMIYVDKVDEIDITGSVPGKRTKLEKLIQRKKDKNDFDVALIQRCDRFTRSGPEHGFWLSHEFTRAGIKAIFVGDDIPEGRHGSVIKAIRYEAAFEQAFSISQRSTQGYQLALETGRCVTSSHTPYACWRLYATPDGKPLHIIRDLRDGRQEKLDPVTHAVIDTYGQIGGGSKGHYRKQKHELVLLMAGNKKHIKVVREIFDLHFRRGLGGKRIASILNKKGILSPYGRRWSQRQVEVIYQQEAYTGRSIGNRTSSAIYHERSHSAPKSVELDEQIHATATSIPKRERPITEWFFQDQPLLKDFLDPELRRLAMEGQEELWGRLRDPARTKRVVPKRADSDYLLTGLLYAKQDGEPLTGVLCGREEKRTRYYRHRRSARGYEVGSIFNRLFPAEPLEAATLKFLRDTLSEIPDLEQRLSLAAEKQIADAQSINEDMASVARRRDEIRNRIRLIVTNFDEQMIEEAKDEIGRLRADAQSLDRQLGQSASSLSLKDMDPERLARLARERFQQLLSEIPKAPREQLKELLGGIVEKVVADMETKAVEIHLALPIWIMRQAAARQMRSAENLGSSAFDQTHRLGSIKLAMASCVLERPSGRPCYRCCRKAA